jgi:hypothetical protein
VEFIRAVNTQIKAGRKVKFPLLSSREPATLNNHECGNRRSFLPDANVWLALGVATPRVAAPSGCSW